MAVSEKVAAKATRGKKAAAAIQKFAKPSAGKANFMAAATRRLGGAQRMPAPKTPKPSPISKGSSTPAKKGSNPLAEKVKQQTQKNKGARSRMESRTGY
jgi:hypothetical protein